MGSPEAVKALGHDELGGAAFIAYIRGVEDSMNGVRFCETPWLLETSDPLRQHVTAQWPQAAGSLGRLYAMGVDAYRLAPRLDQLKALPDSRIEGQSGSLGMTQSQRVVRQLPWAQFVSGQIQRLPDTPR